MRVQYTLPDDVTTAIKQRAESLRIPVSRLVEEFLRAGLRSAGGVTLTPEAAAPNGARSQSSGSKSTTSQNPPAHNNLDDLFDGPARPPVKPWDEMTDAERRAVDPDYDVTEHAEPLTR